MKDDENEQYQAGPIDQQTNGINDLFKQVAKLVFLKVGSWVIPLIILGLVGIMIIGALQSSTQGCYVDSTEAAKGGGKGSWSKEGSQVYNDMKYTIEQFKNLGMSGDNIAGILAVGWRESKFDPTITNPGGHVIGIFQWGNGGVNGNRFGNTEQTVEGEIALAIRELKSSHANTMAALKGANLEDSIKAWDTHFEGLSTSDDGQRKTSQVLATAQEMQKVFKLDFPGHIDLGDRISNESNNGGISGAAADLADCVGAGSGTTSGLPVQGKYNITGGYPNYQGLGGAQHFGVDFQTVNHDGEAGNVYSVADGKVVTKAFNDTGGNYVVIKDHNGTYSYYGHAPSQDAIVVKPNDQVRKGQHISHQGQTGLATGVHVHFAINTQNSSGWGPNMAGLKSPGQYLTNLPKSVIKSPNEVVPGGPFNAK